MNDQHDAPLFDPILPMAEIYNGKWRGLKERLGTAQDPIAMTVPIRTLPLRPACWTP